MASVGLPLLNVLNEKQIDYFDALRALPPPSCQDERCTAAGRDAAVRTIWQWTQSWRAGIDTFALAVSLLDYTLSTARVAPKYTRVCALACMHLAAKVCEEEHEESDFDVYTMQEVRRMQRVLLVRVNWDLSLPTAARYLSVLGQMLSVTLNEPEAVHARAASLLMTALSCHRIAYHHKPAAIALGCLALAAKAEDADAALLYLARQTQVTKDELVSVIVALERLSASPARRGGTRPGRCARKRRRRLNSKGSDAPVMTPIARTRRRFTQPPTDPIAEPDGLNATFLLLYGS